jgi:hypothetical protein
MPGHVAASLGIALHHDLTACSMGPGAWDCLLVKVEHAPAVIAALGDRFDFEDPNDPPCEITRILVSDPA